MRGWLIGGELYAGYLYTDLAEHTELVHLEPEFRDFAVLKAVEDDGVLGDGPAGGWNAGDGSGVGCGHGPASGGFVAVGDDVFDDEVMVGKHGADTVNGLADGGEASGIAGGGVEDDAGREEFRDELGAILVEALLVEAMDGGGLIGGCHGDSLSWGICYLGCYVGREDTQERECTSESERGKIASEELHVCPHIQYMNIYQI